MSALETVDFWQVTLRYRQGFSASLWTFKVVGCGPKSHNTGDEAAEDQIEFTGHGETATDAIYRASQLVDFIVQQRKTGEGLLKRFPVPPFTAEPGGNTDGDVPSDKLTGGGN
jgi:hypothetical protein